MNSLEDLKDLFKKLSKNHNSTGEDLGLTNWPKCKKGIPAMTAGMAKAWTMAPEWSTVVLMLLEFAFSLDGIKTNNV